MTRYTWLAPLALGGATGMRASMAAAALAFTGRRRPQSWPYAALQSRPGRVLAAFMVATELAADKYPDTPSRLEPVGLAARGVLGVSAGAILGPRARCHSLVGAALAGAGAAAGAYGGFAWRRWVADRGWPDLPAAVAEDVAALGLARWSAR